ncbi:MAG: ornithine cyclodeaminase family protein [Gammaproteobacteria bacterium]|nr:ornithine cyclodeaminase family protein [Gammaproteobacteria bacterium]
MNAVGSISPERERGSRRRLYLRNDDIRALMSDDDWLEAAEDGLGAAAAGDALTAAPVHIPVEGGGIHVKSAAWLREMPAVTVKINANFPDNPRRRGLPTIQGVILLLDALDGTLLAIMDSQEITARRTAAAAALAARRLARPDARRALLIGCGEQGRACLALLLRVLPLTQVLLHDRDMTAAERLAEEAHGRQARMIPCAQPAAAAPSCGVILTCTTSADYVLGDKDVGPGTFIAAIGADHPHKREIHPRLYARCKAVCDSLAQCAVMGDLHHALEAGVVRAGDVHGELAEIVAGRKAGRRTAQETWLYDSTGVAALDAAAAVRIYRRALERNR